jgi:hypothetical protein
MDKLEKSGKKAHPSQEEVTVVSCLNADDDSMCLFSHNYLHRTSDERCGRSDRS